MPETFRRDPQKQKYQYRLTHQLPVIEKYTQSLVDEGDKNFLKPAEVESGLASLDSRQLMKDRPEDMSEEDVVGLVKLAAYTEAGTELYAVPFNNAAETYGQGWLSTFNRKVWVPDEKMHASPFVGALLRWDAVSEVQLNAEMKQVQEGLFDYGLDYSPVMATGFGIVQEDLTDHYHGLIGNMAKKSEVNKEYARTVFHVKKRETAHRVFYENFTRMQVIDLLSQGNTEVIDQLAIALSEFTLPGKVIEAVRPYQEQATRYLKLMGADIPELTSQILRHIGNAVDNDPLTAGKLTLNVMERNGVDLPIPFVSTSTARGVLDHTPVLGGRIYKIIGEGILESTKRRLEEDGTEPPKGAEKIERWMKEKIAYQVRNSDIFGGAAA